MTPLFLAVRAVATEFANRIYKTVLIIASVIAALLIALIVWLVSMSAWWWLLAIILIAWILLAAVAMLVAWIIIKNVRPVQSKSQRRKVKALVTKMQSAADVMQTPKFMLLFQLVRASMNPQKYNIIQSVTEHTVGLQKDFEEIRDSFSTR